MIWNISPEIGTIFGITFRWYSILFALGLFLGGWFVFIRSKRLGYTQGEFESLLICLFVGIFLGARLVHCLCYEPEYFLTRPLEIFLPIQIRSNGEWIFTGYHGLASHGGGLGVALAVLAFCKMYKKRFWPLADVLAIATPLAGAFIRLGNLMNSEIVGAKTNVPWAFQFPYFESVAVPRHPAQLYEALFYLALFGILALLTKRKILSEGWPFAIVLIAIGIFRFAIEFLKEIQSPFERGMALDMGQWLSVPLVVLGTIIVVVKLVRRKE